MAVVMSLMEALLQGNLFVIESYVSQNPGCLDLKDENGRSAIHWAAAGGHLKIITSMLKNITSYDYPDCSGWTPLIIASSAGHTEVVQFLLSKGVNVNASTHGGHSAVQYAASRNRPEILEALLKHHADPNIKDERDATPLHRASSRGNLKCVELLLKSSSELDVNAQDLDGNTCLHLACEENHVEIAQLLVSYGVNISLVNKEGKTALEMGPKSLATILSKKLINN